MNPVATVTCPGCGEVSPFGKLFCAKCGSSIPRVCPSCRAGVTPGKKFCGDCGAALSQEAPSALQSTPQADVDAERRQLTVLFCDLVGSTVLSEQLDPEELREVVRSYQEAAAGAIETYGGHIAQYLGDGLLVYFGYPHAHDDDAQAAVRTGLGIVEAVQGLSGRLRDEYGVPIDVRIGIHTGLVVVGEMGGGERHERLAVGDTPNIAARLQGLADPGQVVIGAPTYRLVEGLFECRELGAHSLKGISVPMHVYAVGGESAVRTRLEVAVTGGLAPMVGRKEDLETVLERWRRATGGAGQVILISGEPGVGKSRFVLAVKERLGDSPHARLETRGSQYAQNTALYPIIDLVQRIFAFSREDSTVERWDRIRAALAPYATLPENVVPLFASLLSLPYPDGFPPLDEPPLRQRELVLEALLAWLFEAASRQPQLFVVEDLHWADPSTLELLGRLIERACSGRVLCLLTFRPEFVPPWERSSDQVEIELDRLPPEQAEMLVERVTDGGALPPTVLQQILTRTDGVPLFVEELTKAVLESGRLERRNGDYHLVGDLEDLAIPSTLQGSLMARLDRLEGAKEVAQVASVLGREFQLELLEAVAPYGRPALDRELSRLLDAELLYRRGDGERTTYYFKHALIQDTAYQSLLKSTRQRYHRAAGSALEDRFPEVTAAQPELLARHFAEAREFAKAIHYWEIAGKRAMERSAFPEAIAHFTAGLDLLPGIGAEGTEVELALQMGLGMALMSARGYSAPGVDASFRRAFEICARIGDIPELFPVIYGLSLYDFIGANYARALERTEQLLAIGDRTRNPISRLEAYYMRGLVLIWVGDAVGARAHLEEALQIYEPSLHRTLPGAAAPEPACMVCLGLALWENGLPETGTQMGYRAVERAEAANHPYTLAYVLGVLASLLSIARDWEKARQIAARGVAVAEANGLTFFKGISSLVFLAAGGPAQRIERTPAALEAYRSAGAGISTTHFVARLGEAYEELGRHQEALDRLDEALHLARTSGEGFFEPEILRLKGEVLWGQPYPDLAAAERSLREAREAARVRGLRIFELRAATSLARLLHDSGRSSEALELLFPLHAWFTEGMETPDLREAGALLGVLRTQR